jgi:hypothetical protein
MDNTFPPSHGVEAFDNIAMPSLTDDTYLMMRSEETGNIWQDYTTIHHYASHYEPTLADTEQLFLRRSSQDGIFLAGMDTSTSMSMVPDSNMSLKSSQAPLSSGKKRESPSYAQILYDLLLAAPSHELSLKEIYETVLKEHEGKCHTKGYTKNGWMNGVRHNLSMNKVNTNHFDFISYLCILLTKFVLIGL